MTLEEANVFVGPPPARPTQEDIEAFNRLTNQPERGVTSPRVINLPGAIHCRHILYGSGCEVVEVRTPWHTQPYRHHAYVVEIGDAYCKCGNPEAVSIHKRCDLEGEL